MNFRERIFKVN